MASTPKLRILCLHGRCQTGSTFERKLERVVGKSESFADFVSPVCNEDRAYASSWESHRDMLPQVCGRSAGATFAARGAP